MNKETYLIIGLILMLAVIFFLGADLVTTKQANQRFFSAYQEQADYYERICDINKWAVAEKENAKRMQDINTLLNNYVIK